MLDNFNGRTQFRNVDDLPSIPIYVNACLTGMGAAMDNKAYTACIPDRIRNKGNIVHFEMINLVIAVHKWLDHIQNSRVTMYCYNAAVVDVCRNLKTKDPILGACIRNLFMMNARFNIDFECKHIRGDLNVVADALSRKYDASNVFSKHKNYICSNYELDDIPDDMFDMVLSM